MYQNGLEREGFGDITAISYMSDGRYGDQVPSRNITMMGFTLDGIEWMREQFATGGLFGDDDDY